MNKPIENEDVGRDRQRDEDHDDHLTSVELIALKVVLFLTIEDELGD